MILLLPHGMYVIVPAHACTTAAEFEGLCAEIAQRVHLAQTTKVN
jgi:hypothetical protein